RFRLGQHVGTGGAETLDQVTVPVLRAACGLACGTAKPQTAYAEVIMLIRVTACLLPAYLFLSAPGAALAQDKEEPSYGIFPLKQWVKQRGGAKPARLEAARAIAEMGPAAKDAVPALIAVLKDKNREVRKAAAGALGKIGPAAEPAVPAL